MSEENRRPAEPEPMSPEEAAAWARGFAEGVARATVPVALDFDEIERLAQEFQASGPDEYPLGYYRAEAERVYRERHAKADRPPKPAVTVVVDHEAVETARQEGYAQAKDDHDPRGCVAGYVEKIQDVQRNLLTTAAENPEMADVFQEHADGMGIALTIIQTSEVE